MPYQSLKKFFFSHNPKLGPPTFLDFRNFDILRIKYTLSLSGPNTTTEVTLKKKKKKEFQAIIDME